MNKVENVYASSFNQNGNTLVTAASDGLYFWKFQENNYSYLQKLCTGTLQMGILFSKFQDLFISHDLIGQFGIVKMINGKWKLDQLIQGHQDQICSIMLQQDDKQILTASQKNGIKIWYYQRILFLSLLLREYSGGRNFVFPSRQVRNLKENSSTKQICIQYSCSKQIREDQKLNVINQIIFRDQQYLINELKCTQIKNLSFSIKNKYISHHQMLIGKEITVQTKGEFVSITMQFL